MSKVVVPSLLWNDAYKLFMQQFALHNSHSTHVKVEFECRDKTRPLGFLADRLRESIHAMEELSITEEEISYLERHPMFSKDYLVFLRNFKYNPKRDCIITRDMDSLKIEVNGYWPYVIGYEVPILAMVSNAYTDAIMLEKDFNTSQWRNNAEIKLRKKLSYISNFMPDIQFADFSTRRAASLPWQDRVVEICKEESPQFIGTSNVALARKYGTKFIGTQAHEYYMVHQGKFRIEDSQKIALKNWCSEFKGKLGIALTDTIGMDAFIRDFDGDMARRYDGIRHDSGDPLIWGHKAIKMYKDLDVNPKTKTLVFSDGLDFEKVLKIHREFKDQVKMSFGVGTNLGNDTGIAPLPIVMKVTKTHGRPVAKLSDSAGKTMCRDEVFLTYLKKVYGRD